jgi:glycogenin glucosyltransferase
MDSSAKVLNEAYVTLATNDNYAIGALVLGHSLKSSGTNRCLVVMVTRDVSSSLRESMKAVFDLVTDVNVLDSNDTVNLELLSRPDLGITFTKLHCWRLTQFTKCVFLDADTLVVQNVDELFDRDELSAAPDVGWPDCFNSGVFVYEPSINTYAALLNLALTRGSFDGGDQGLLNQFFKDWATKDITRRLSFIYNVVSQEFYTYQPAFKKFGKNAKIVHFIGATKPWHASYNKQSGSVDTHGDVSHRVDLMKMWWTVFIEQVQPTLDPEVVGFTEQMSSLTIYTKQQLDDEHRQFSWERGQIDYLGVDSFDNILSQLQRKLDTPPNPE